jgi:hypothetical protein
MVSYAGFIPVMLVALVLNLTPCRRPLRRPKWTATLRLVFFCAFEVLFVNSSWIPQSNLMKATRCTVYVSVSAVNSFNIYQRLHL